MTLDHQSRSETTDTHSHQAIPRVRPVLVLTVVLIAALAINVETTIVNVALPTLNTELAASTRGLQWIVDAYNLAFAALVLAGGTVGDKFGRRGTLIAGLVLFAASSVAAALCTSTGPLIGARLVMGMASALIYPTTLAIITDTFRDPRQRAAAIGIWGAVTGLGVAIGPILGGALLESFWWGSLFLALAPFALVAAVGAATLVPASTRDETSRLDRVGLLLSVVMLGALVYTIIEAPDRGWGSASTIGGFVLAIAAAVAFAWWEGRRSDPLIDVRLFTNLRFSAASGAVTVAFFALFGFIFLITQFFQLLQGYGPLETGVRILPVALSIAVGSVLGTRIAVTRVGTKAVVFTGLLMLAAAFFWVTRIDTDVSYLVVAGQMVLLGGGLGLTTAPATDSIMGVVRPEQAGAGSAVNDATRQIGGTLGVAVLGSIFSTLYIRHLSDSAALESLPEPVQVTAREGLAQGLQVAARAPASPMAEALRDNVSEAFMSGLHAGCMTAAVVCVVGAVFALAFLPAHPVSGVRS
ncbi:MFS transporter [Mycolicibacterium hodleri]|uniref:DHA2 family efflux MFS transporter permease subunit n=1 Tax=Mycolicibacterium hodleri TaxID=49897 RepID=A0A502EFK3_9MYCO|nr:MFS transporter [Mycolicibacterium hodleri]TPG35121.1 DHA2 family efflux MFS transporter permease subunit [Mycolicibacterium hodleri]